MAGSQNEQRGLDEGSRPKGNADVGVLQLLPISPPEPDFFFFIYLRVLYTAIKAFKKSSTGVSSCLRLVFQSDGKFTSLRVGAFFPPP